MACCVAISLQGNFVIQAVRESLEGQKLIKLLLERLAEEQETEWIDVIVKELVSKGDFLIEQNVGVDVLSAALSSEALNQESVDMWVNELAYHGCDADKLRQAINEVQQERMPITRTKRNHYAPSVMHPWLKDAVENGYQIPTPPTPPPQNGYVFCSQPTIPEFDREMSRTFVETMKQSREGIASSSFPMGTTDDWLHNGFPAGLPMPPPPKPFVQDVRMPRLDEQRPTLASESVDHGQLGNNQLLMHQGIDLVGTTGKPVGPGPTQSSRLSTLDENRELPAPLARLLGPVVSATNTRQQQEGHNTGSIDSPFAGSLLGVDQYHGLQTSGNGEQEVNNTCNGRQFYFSHAPWKCTVCMYEHRDIEAQGLVCACCGTVKTPAS